MKQFGSSLFSKLQENQILDNTLKNVRGGGNGLVLSPVIKNPGLNPGGPGGTTNDCTGTGGDCWDADGNTSVIEDAVWTGGKESGNDTCD